MDPAKPPLPTPWNFPFQPVAGIQTSASMLESLEGLMVRATRQKPGTLTGPPSGGLKEPAATVWAVVMVAPDSESLERSSQGVTAPAMPAGMANSRVSLHVFGHMDS